VSAFLPQANQGVLELFSHLARLQAEELRLMLCFRVVVQLIEALKYASMMAVRAGQCAIEGPFGLSLGSQGLDKLGMYVHVSRGHNLMTCDSVYV